MRILQVITDTDRRGAQVFATDLSTAMSARGHEVETVALAPGAQSPGLDVAVLGERQRGIRTLRTLRRRMSSADITIAHGSSTGLACALAGLGPGRPFVYRQISDTRFWAGSWPRRLRVALYLRTAKTIVALSPATRQAVHEHLWIPLERIFVVPNGVSASVFRPPTDGERAAARTALDLPPDAFVALYIGALVREKGIDIAIEAVGHLSGVTLAIAGGGPDQTRLHQLADQVDDGRVKFLGTLDRPMDGYAAADVVVLPSLSESMPATLIEAGLCGLPVIATDTGSVGKIVVDRQTGLLVPVGDGARLRRAIVDLLDDREKRRSMGDAARCHCLDRFEIEVVAAEWLAVLDPRIVAAVAR